MNRVEVLQRLLNERPQATYLEIGVFKGQVLLHLKGCRKIAVDPQFKISRLRRLVADIGNQSIQYFPMTSDRFFDCHAEVLAEGIDVALVDGLHTHTQAYNDVVNCLKYLKPNGVIVMHDCLPPHAAAALPADSPAHAQTFGHPEWTGEWTGDVYKSVMQLRSQHPDLNVFVLNCDYGLGIVHRGSPDSTLAMELSEIEQISYEAFRQDQRNLLNLQEPRYFHDWLHKAA